MIKGFRAALLCLLLAGPAIGENLLVNGEFDGGYFDTPPGWTEEGYSDAYGDFVQTNDGKAYGHAVAYDAPMQLWAVLCTGLRQEFIAPATGSYHLAVSGEFGTSWSDPPDSLMTASGDLVIALSSVGEDPGQQVWMAHYDGDGSGYSTIEIAENLWLQADTAYAFEIHLKSSAGECWELSPNGGESFVYIEYVRFEEDDAVPTERASWSALKSLY